MSMPGGFVNPVSVYPESEESARLRFQVELEFVQCLANPNYLNFLAQRGHFKDRAFINYLKYLLYWRKPEYAAYLKYPQCLNLLELLQYEGFRTEIINTPCAKFIEDQLLLHWQHYPRKRLKLLEQQQRQQNGTVEGADVPREGSGTCDGGEEAEADPSPALEPQTMIHGPSYNN